MFRAAGSGQRSDEPPALPHDEAYTKGTRWRPDSLTLRLAAGITLLVVTLLAAALLTISRLHFSRTIEARRRAADLQNRILAATLRHQMIEKDFTLIQTMLSEIGSEPEVQEAVILDHEGVVKFSSQPDVVGSKLSQDSPTCLVCHSQSESVRERWAILEGQDEEMLRSVLPFENRTECHDCHDSQRRINGLLMLDISLAQVEAELRRDGLWMAAGTFLLALLLLSGTSLLIRRLVLKRLGRLGRTARSIAAGHFSERAVVDGTDTIGSLARDFNNMAEATSKLIREVRERESHLANVMNSLDDGLVVLDRDFRVVGANRSFSRRLGKHPEVLRDTRCHEAVGGALPCCSQGQDCPAQRCVATGQVQRAVFRSADGECGQVQEVYASPILDENGNVLRVVEIWRDITERVREEERLVEVEHLVSLGVLASGLSHEVNTPLASMLTCAESVLGRIEELGSAVDGDGLIPAIRESAATIRREVLRCRDITERFRRFSRGIPPSAEPIDVREVVARVVSLASPTAREAGVTIAMEGEEELPAATANTELVQHVVLNLLVNAIQSFDERGGTITVRFQVDTRIRIQVHDTGRGITPEDQKHLFEPFRSRKPQGTGLGLFLSRGFMRRFGGEVRLLESQVGVGSSFEVVLPPTEENVS